MLMLEKKKKKEERTVPDGILPNRNSEFNFKILPAAILSSVTSCT